ncbi:hypothetical protein O181_071107 [Austropuccinia psidii MF-1]|uniref:Integrase catalytic domain-containing protein n=1 Tax=Austropuccinia psidii MF-1 TaxID=1389203 RepID=A0A9Q3F761_9BASI|nr:hypothetical protein [Austropuccinia psidii MF-1]
MSTDHMTTPADHPSSDDEGYRTKIITLTRENWVQWSCQFENFLLGKGHESLLSPPSETDKVSLKFKKRNGSALALLWTCVSPDMHGILLAHKTSFYNSWEALGKTCGKNSVVIMCETLFKLISIQFKPGSSLEKHIDFFQKTYASYQSITQNSENQMIISSEVAAAFFIRSLNQDRELSGLIPTLYDITPFELNTVLNRVAVEHCCQGPVTDQVMTLDKQEKSDQSKVPARGGHRGRGKGTNRGRGRGKGNSQPRREDDSLKRLDKLEKLFARFEATSKNPNINVISESSKEPSADLEQSDSDAYVIEDEILMSGSEISDQIYLDSGAGRSVVNNLRSLTNVVRVQKQVNTYSEPVNITHQGVLIFRGVHISPVYYAPKGKVNLLSVSQLTDHGLKPVFKGGAFLIMQGKRIIAKFNRMGNLFATRLQSQFVFSLLDSVKKRDWHTLLGHPSDEYTKRITGTFTPASECQIHMDTLEISPPSRQGYRYVLAIIDDFSRFNRIYLMTEKGKAEGFIRSFLNELNNKLNITPAYIHTDRGGEFDSNFFKQNLLAKGICLERGPAHSPQTNGVAERFNQSLLTKVRCLLAQSNIPIAYWDEAALHASLLLNHLPHRFLDMYSPNDVLLKKSSMIQPVQSLNCLLPFGIKVAVKNENPSSKVNPSGQIMRALTFEPYSDALRVLDTATGKVRVTRDYSQLKSETIVTLQKDPCALPREHARIPPRTTDLPVLKDPIPQSNAPIISHHAEDSQALIENQSPSLDPTPTTVIQNKTVPKYAYVPYYETAPSDVSSQIRTQNIIEGAKRQRRAPDRLMLADVVTYRQALSDPCEEDAWRAAMKQEYDSLTNHNTGELVPYPSDGTKVIGGMWRLTRKRNEFGEVYRHKARWVVLGNHQEHMIHYFDTWASVGRNETFKVMLILVVCSGYIPYQFDIETAFLHGKMDANVYVKQVKGFEFAGKEGWVWRLNKSLYGTKQAPRMWQAKLVEVLGSLEMRPTRADDSLYSNKDQSLFLHVHVDDGFLIGKQENEILLFLNRLNAVLKLNYQKRPTHHLGYCIDWSSKGTVRLGQQDLISQLLKDHDMENSRNVKTPCNSNLLRELEEIGDPVSITSYQQAIGSLNYLAQHTRPDISFTVNALSRYATQPTARHWVALKHLFRYLKGSSELRLTYTNHDTHSCDGLVGWADADYANDRIDRKSITGNLITFHGNPVSWLSKKQSVVAQSTTEAEFISMNICAKQLRWLTYLLNDFNQEVAKPVICNDNSGAVTISSQASLNANTKHIEIRYQYIRDLVVKKLMSIKQVGTNDMLADALTKPLGAQKVDSMCKQLHLKNQGGVSN